jgi:hypothetical protein
MATSPKNHEETINIAEDEIEIPKISASGFEITPLDEQLLELEQLETASESIEENLERETAVHPKEPNLHADQFFLVHPKDRPEDKRKIEPPNQFGDLKTTKHLTKMNSNIMKSITDIFNAEIVKFAKRINAEFPEVPINGVLAIWCKQQSMPLSTFEINEDPDHVYDVETDIDEEVKPKVVKKSPAKKKAKAADADSVIESNGIASDAEDDVPSSDEEVENGKPKKVVKKKAAPKKKSPGKECEHKYIKGKNAGTKCTTTVKGEGNFCSKHKVKTT